MIFTETNLQDAYLIELEKIEDQRGFFARAWCKNEFQVHGLIPRLVQASLSFSKKKGTLRGMHYQNSFFKETKLVRCTKGAIYDVIIDLRPNSPTYKHWFGVELTEDNYKTLYVPENFAHGFETLQDNTEVLYQMSEYHAPTYESGVRYNDPAFGIAWPLAVKVISEKDKSWPNYEAY